ncbi:hypothetical protein M0812_21899 [Anaeramoeba flamelloides]|uniref:BZIP domain-containing protein n=1 Tax=Anaeramoeba flamelloides TaxID=1746091 RepID=A0AAV7YT34_9EUKA|nr:hypothetical protein M0812_21899 [Anaeramoeba flamelloides]
MTDFIKTKKQLKFEMKQIDYSILPMCFVDESMKFLYYNQLFLKRLHYKKKTLKKITLFSISSDISSPNTQLKELFKQHSKESGPKKFVYSCWLKTGNEKKIFTKIDVSSFKVGSKFKFQLTISENDLENENQIKTGNTNNNYSNQCLTSSASTHSSKKFSSDSSSSSTKSSLGKQNDNKDLIFSLEDEDYDDRFNKEIMEMKSCIMGCKDTVIEQNLLSKVTNIEKMFEKYIETQNKQMAKCRRYQNIHRRREQNKYKNLEKQLNRRLYALVNERDIADNLKKENAKLEKILKQTQPLLIQFIHLPKEIQEICNNK